MGEAKSRLVRIRGTQPTCTYCGVNPTTSVDHCPPIAIFDNRFRPAGLEFGACEACHRATRDIDNVVALVARVNSGEGRHLPGEVLKYLESLRNNYPSIHRSITPADDDSNVTIGPYGVEVDMAKNDPSELHRTMIAFAGRFGLAMYRAANQRLPDENTTIFASWFPSHFAFAQELMDEFKRIAPGQTLEQGREGVWDQFRYNTAWRIDGSRRFATYAEFRESFAVYAEIGVGMRYLITDQQPNMGVLALGFLQGFVPPR